MKPIPAKPRMIIAHMEVSGTGAALEAPVISGENTLPVVEIESNLIWFHSPDRGRAARNSSSVLL
jgi:hypothetical protein